MKILMRTLTLAVAAVMIAAPALAQDKVWRHASATIGEPKYPADFTHFDYVNADAPKGGVVRLGDMGSFDTFNPILPRGEPAPGMGLIYETLMTASLDEVLTDYGLIAEAVSWPDDYSSATFRINASAKWQDGEPVKASDVIWSFNKLKELNPNYAQYYANVTKAQELSPGEVTFTFDQTGNRELPKILGQLLILPQHWWEGTDSSGKQRNIAEPTMEIPLGSGPYKIDSFVAGRTVSYKRVPGYWGVNHPTQVGQNNFDEIRYELFLDLTIQFEAFKADQIDYWLENQAKRWATAYDFPAVNDGRVVRELFPEDYNGSGLMVGWVPNLRRIIFQDEKVREALNYAYDFEELNRTLFYDQYTRIDSYYFGLPFASTKQPPQGEELEILNSVKDQIPASVFTDVYVPPVGGDPTKLRGNLRTALGLLNEAGYTLDGTRLVDGSGKQLAFEILLNGPTQEPNATAFQKNLQTIGIDATIRTVDSAQYVDRVRAFDYDLIYTGWGQSMSPGNEQRFQWGTAAADEEGSQNYLGIKDPGIDAIIEKIIFADDQETLYAATAALDRVLLAHHFMVPTYALRNSRVARWDRFGRPDPLPEFSSAFPTVWWWDEAKAAKTGAPR